MNFSKEEIYNREPAKTDYANISNWPDLRVLVVVDPETSEILLQTLIQAARDIDRYKVGLRNFLFARLDEFTLSDPSSLFSRVWQTPVKGDPHISILE